MRAGKVLLIGRTNAGKSTLLNNLIGQKVAITSRKPQTTRFPIRAVYEDERGQIIFTDTPGIYSKALNRLSKGVETRQKEALQDKPDVVVYLIDHTRYRDTEENRALGIYRQFADIPRIVAFNKWDIDKISYYPEYRFIEEETDAVLKISALKGTNLDELLQTVFSFLPESKDKLIDTEKLTTPLLNIDSRIFIEELIREKAYKYLGEELPYTVAVRVNEIDERKDGTLYINADILTTDSRYKGMIIGKGGKKIGEIGSAARRELEVARGGEKVFLDLEVKVEPNWINQAYG